MTCVKAYEVDLAAFLLDPRGRAWDEFRAHYPTCPDCAAEVAAWTTLGLWLSPDHPEPEALLRWADEPAALSGDERAAIAIHVARCAACADELRALEGFAARSTAPSAEAARVAAARDVAVAPPTAAKSSAAGNAGTSRDPSRRADVRPSTRAPSVSGAAAHRDAAATGRSPLRTAARVLWNPVVPYAAVLALLLLPLMRERLPENAGAPATTEPAVAVRSEAPAPAAPGALAKAERDRATRSESTGASYDTKAETRGQAPPRAQPGELSDALRSRSDDATGGEGRTLSAPAARSAPPAVEAPKRRAEVAKAQPKIAPPEPGVAESGRERAVTPSAPRVAQQRQGAPAGALASRAASPEMDVARVAPSTGEAAPAAAAARERAAARLSPPSDAGTRKLVVDVPKRARRPGELEVRITDASGDRELRRKVHVAAHTKEIALNVPTEWLGKGGLLVEVRDAGGQLLARSRLDAR